MIILNIREDLYNGCLHEMEGGEKIDICKICKGILIVEINKNKESSARKSLEMIANSYLNSENNLEKQIIKKPLKQKKMTEKQVKLLNMFIERKKWIIDLINNTNNTKIKMFLFERGYFYINEKIVLYSTPLNSFIQNPSYYDIVWEPIQISYDKWTSEQNDN